MDAQPLEDSYPLSSAQEDILSKSGRPGHEYVLSPMQQGLLFHALSAAQPGIYIQQMVCALHEALDAAAFARAWARVMERHAILRTCLRWQDAREPGQVILRKVQIPIEEQDWRGVPAAQQEAQLTSFLEADRRRGFDLTQSPLLRVTLVRRADADWTCIWTYHHILLDGRSHTLVLKEVFAYYEAYRRGEDLNLPKPRPYRDYIYWLRGQDWAKAAPYWKEALHGFRAPTPLLAVAPVPGTTFPTEPPHGKQTLRLSAELTAALQAFVRQHELTLNTLLQGAYAALLGRYSGEEDVVFGATRACRRSTLEGAEAMIGLFINTLPVRGRLSPEVTVLPFLKDLRAQSLAVRPYEHTPLVKVQEWSAVPPGMPLFESVFVFESYELTEVLRAEGGAWTNREFQLLEETNYPLALCAYGGERLLLKILYRRPRFDDATVGRMFGHLQTLLEGFLAHPERRVAELPILTEQEHRQIVYEWNDTAADYPRDRCIHQLLEEQAERTPDATAVLFEGRATTYRELNERANRLAHHLRGLGVGPGVLVGICIERSTDMIVGVLAITKAGGAYVPLDPAYPKDRLAFMLEDTRAPVLLTQEQLLERLPETPARVLCLDTLGDALAQESGANPVSGVVPCDLAYIIYTSGSTGKPKGVVLRHGPVVNLIDWVNATYAVGAGDRQLFVTSLNFDLSVYDIFGILGAGGAIRVGTGAELRDPERLLQILCTEPITFWDSAPPQLQQLAPFFAGAPEGPGRSSLRLVFLSGDWIPVPLPDAIRATFPGAQVVSLGGATEAAIWSNYYPLGAVDPKWASIPYGKPMKNARYHVLDGNGNPVPVGVPAQLHIGGLCLADGYLNRPELTAEKFVPDPFGKEAGARLYRTGDLARYFPDGNLEFLGRMDFQVKIRGFRIELGEIEAVLAQHPAVRECLVTALKDESGDRSLCGYVILRAGQSGGLGELRTFLQEKLPAHMVPGYFVPLDAFPLNPNGKIDRKALPSPGRERRDEAATYAAPSNPTEQAIAEIWAAVLGIDRVGIHDDFFALGGHSLKATQVVSRLRQRLQVELPLPAFFRSPTVAALAAALQKAAGAGPVAAITADPAHETRVPASFAQRRLWFLDQFGQDREVYNVAYTARIRGALNEGALRQAFAALVERHHSLRTTFADEGGQPLQVIAPPAPVDLPRIDLTARAAAEREAEARRLADAESRQVFDLARGPVWSVKLVALDAEEHLLLWTMHHIISDGWSMWLLFRDLGALYESALTGRPAALPPLPVQYTDFSRWQREQLQGAILEKQLGYWKKCLAGTLPPLQLPISRSRPKVQSFRGAIHAFTLSAPLVKALEELGRREETTPFMTLLAGFMALLHRYSGQEDVLIGVPIANRNRAEIEEVVGFFVNTLVARADVSGDVSFRELLRRVRQRMLEAFAHQDLPLDMLVQELRPERSTSHQPLFQVLFNYLQGASLNLTAGGLTWTTRPLHNGTSKFDLTLMLEETPCGLESYLEYNTDLFEADAIERMAGHLRMLLEGCAADPDRPLSQVSLLTEAERRQTLVEWNATAADYPRDRCVHQLFEEQAARTPDRPAVVFENRQLTYGALNAWANTIAHHLKTLGVGPEVLVGLFVERSAEMLAGLLGILKAGGAYVPLDPAFPADRLAFYVQDSAMPVLLTQKRLLGRLPAHKARVVCIPEGGEPCGTPLGEPPAPPKKGGGEPCGTPLGEPPAPPKKGGGEPCGTPLGEPPAPPKKGGGEPCGTPLGEPPAPPKKGGGEPCGTPLGEPPAPPKKGGEIGPTDIPQPLANRGGAGFQPAKEGRLETCPTAVPQRREDNPASTSTANNLVYVIYTSGSTGKPKGVQVLHGALTNFLASMRKQPGLTEQDVLLAVTTLSFDIHALELWLPLTVGARVVVASKDVAGDGVRLLGLLNQSGATVLQATPATWRLLLAAGWEGSPKGGEPPGTPLGEPPATPKGLEALCGGEPLTAELAENLLRRVGSLWNMYGPTETTVWSTVHRVQSAAGPLPVGRPIDNTQVYLVDKRLNPVPLGVVGELLIGGDGLARGYLNRPELTAEKFIPDVFSGRTDGRLYRTGDLARYLPDGTLECLGRLDHQVKVRGFRIELGEIETVLGQHPAVKANVVVARKDEAGADHLAAYLIPQAGKDCRVEELRRALQEKLPDYMVPSYFVLLESFPLTPNGKIDRKALPAPQQSANGVGSRAFVAPRDDAERALAPLWEEILKVKPVGVTDNFFDLGGHSFLAAVLIARIRQQLGHTLPLGTLFSAPTVEKLASALTQRLEAGTESSLVPLQEGGSKPPLFMIAGVGGHVFTFHKFARLLGADQPVYGVKAIGVDGAHQTPETIEAMAAHYVKEITAICPQGPYLLSGYSIGAIVAYELAVQLRALGHSVPALIVFDMFAPGYPRRLPKWRRLWMHLCTFLRLPFREKKAYLGERMHKLRVRALHWMGQGLRNAPAIGVEGLQEDVLKRVWLALTTAQSHYRPQRQFDGKVVLLKAEIGFKWPATIIDDPLFGWGQWALGGVETHTVPGGHMELFHDKNINLVADKVRESVGSGEGR